MVFADHFDEAEILETLSWIGMTLKARCAKLASLYLDNESNIENAHRNYNGPTLGCVRVFVKSVYMPTRGEGGITFEGTLSLIAGQRKIRDNRSAYRPWTFKTRKLNKRRHRISKQIYTIWTKRYGQPEKVDNNCITMTRMAGCVAILDGGGYRHKARVYLRSLSTGEIKIVVLQGTSNSVNSLPWALMRMLPQEYRCLLFDGVSSQLDFEKNGFVIQGEIVPWRAVKVYTGDDAHKMQAHAQ